MSHPSFSQSQNVTGVWFKERFTFNKIYNTWKFEKLHFRELCDSKLSGLHPFDNMVIIHWVINRSKTERLVVSSWETNPWSNFCDLHGELICHNKWHPRKSKISTPLEIAVGTHFHVWHDTNTILVFLSIDGEGSWFLLQSLVSLLSGGTVQPENTYFCILKVTGQVWDS